MECFGAVGTVITVSEAQLSPVKKAQIEEIQLLTTPESGAPTQIDRRAAISRVYRILVTPSTFQFAYKCY